MGKNKFKIDSDQNLGGGTCALLYLYPGNIDTAILPGYNGAYEQQAKNIWADNRVS